MTIPVIVRRRPWTAAAALIVLLILVGLVLRYGFGVGKHLYVPPPSTDVSTFSSANFEFDYPRILVAQEFASGVVGLGGKNPQGGFIPLVDVVRYKSDPDRAIPVSFDAFVTRQAENLCGTDFPGQTITCTAPVVEEYNSPTGLLGKKVSLTLVRKDTKTGATTQSTFAPIYVFNTTDTPAAGEALRYQAVFVYPDFTSFLLASSSASLVPDIAASVRVTSGTRYTSATTTPKQ